MPKKIVLRVAVAVAAIAIGVALIPSGGLAVVHLGRTNPAAIPGATLVSFSPGTNPAFKVDGDTACATGRSGHLWAPVQITATGVKNPATESVVVDLAGVSVTLSAPDFTATVSTSQSFDCANLVGNALPYTATSYNGGHAQGGTGSSISGLYATSQID